MKVRTNSTRLLTLEEYLRFIAGYETRDGRQMLWTKNFKLTVFTGNGDCYAANDITVVTANQT